MKKIKKIFTNVRVIILLILLLLAIVTINPQPWKEGVAIRNVEKDGPADVAGIENPEPNIAPMQREVIQYLNNRPIVNIDDYYEVLSEIGPNRTVKVVTDQRTYNLLTKKDRMIIEENNKTEEVILDEITLGMDVYNAPKSNIRMGLDLQGGTRVLLQPERDVTNDEIGLIIENLKERLNVYGLSDIVIREASDLSGNQYIMIEIAGINDKEVRELLAKQGKFEAKINNETVFRGGQDITYVCRSADCAGIDPTNGCGQLQTGEWTCRFRFSISLTPEAAQKQAKATDKLEVITENGNEYLSAPLELYLDNQKVDELNIGADLKGKAATEIAISGPGYGGSQAEAMQTSLQNMKRLQTILITGSLPVKLNVAKTDQISPRLGKTFIKNAWLIALLVGLAITIIIVTRYKRWELSVPLIVTLASEMILVLGFATLIKWNIDMAAIAGIIVAIGTGIDDQIVITDETLRKKGNYVYGMKERIKRAFFIILGSYFTTVGAMVPLMFAGAGLVKGFAITTIIGVTVGVLITRPTYTEIMKIMIKKD